MESVIIQSVVKANTPKPSAVAVSPENTTASTAKGHTPVSQLAGNSLPSVNDAPTQVLQEKQKIEETVSELNSFVQNIQRGIQFSVQEETGRSIITITDKDTGEEIRRFPSEQALSIAAQIAETLAVPDEASLGLLVNGKA